MKAIEKLTNPALVRVVVLPLLGAFGAMVAVLWPHGHAAFCAGLAGVLS